MLEEEGKTCLRRDAGSESDNVQRRESPKPFFTTQESSPAFLTKVRLIKEKAQELSLKVHLTWAPSERKLQRPGEKNSIVMLSFDVTCSR